MIIAQHYKIEEELGQGGMGVVYKGTDTRNGQTVAIKWLKPALVDVDPIHVERFIQEGEVLRKLNHPNIVKMLTASQEDGYYLVMEYVEGGSLLDVLTETPRMKIQQAMEISLDLADALTRAHRLKVLHRDIKPANVLIASDGTPRLTDFGVARVGESKATQEGAVVGTLSYISPEGFRGEEIDERADIWAFGIMLYEMLAGKRPFTDANAAGLIQAILTQPVPTLETVRPDIPTALVDLVSRMLERDRHARIPSVRLVGAELEAILRGGDTSSIQYIGALQSTGRFDSSGDIPMVTVELTRDLLPPSNLPAQPTQFVGRGDELAAISSLLTKGETHLITLLGSGGIGKTRLALAVAEGEIQRYVDGTFFIPLAPIDNVEFLVPTIAEHIDFSFSSSTDQTNELINYLSEKYMLLVMDNFEHMIDGADVVQQILQRAPNITILVTSRQQLRLRGETLFEVQGMVLPETTDSLETIQSHSSVKLFMQSALRVAPDFELDEESAPQVVRILHLVNGLPLGIELAAAWLEALQVEEIADEIEQSLDFLETDLRDVPERHRSIRAVFDYSWNLLPENERDVFMKLSIFRGGFEREAAQKVTGANLRTLTTLVNKSLVQRDPTGRYQLHRLLRQYAEEALENHPEQEQVRMAHAQYYGQFIRRLESVFNTHREIRAIEQFEAELENNRVALRYAIEHGLWDDISAVMHTILLFYLGRSMVREGIEVFQEIRNGLTTAGKKDSLLYWRASMHEAWLSNRVGEYDHAWELANGANDYFKQHDYPLGAARALNQMSYVLMMRGDFDRSVDAAKEAQDITERIDAQADWFQSIGNRGYAEYLRGNLAEAQRLYEMGIKKFAEVDYSPSGEAYFYNNLGEFLRDQNELDRAKELFQQSYAIFADYKLRRGMAFTLNNLGGLSQRRGEFDEAREMYLKANELNRDIGDKRGIGHSLSALGQLAAFTGDFEPAKSYYNQSLELRRSMGDRRGVSESLNDLARVCITMGALDLALDYYEQSVATAREIHDKTTIGSALSGRGLTYVMRGDTDTGLNDLNEAIAIAEEIGNDYLLAEAKGGLAIIALEVGDYDGLREHNHEVLQLAVGAGLTPMVIVSVAAMAFVKGNTGEEERAMELLSLVSGQNGGLYMQTIQTRLDKLESKLREELDEATLKRANQHGKSLDLYQTANDLLQERSA